ncbi:MAG: hypothetical protein Q9199_001376 [Rusavskia elegans]
MEADASHLVASTARPATSRPLPKTSIGKHLKVEKDLDKKIRFRSPNTSKAQERAANAPFAFEKLPYTIRSKKSALSYLPSVPVVSENAWALTKKFANGNGQSLSKNTPGL